MLPRLRSPTKLLLRMSSFGWLPAFLGFLTYPNRVEKYPVIT